MIFSFYHFSCIYELEYFCKENHSLLNVLVTQKYSFCKKRWDKSLILFSLFFSIFQSLSCVFLLSYYYELVDLNIFDMFQFLAVIVLNLQIVNLWPVGSS